MKKILVPTDFSVEASYALDVANEIAKQYNFAQITLLHIVEAPSAAAFNSTGEYVSENNENNLYFLQLIKKVNEQFKEILTTGKWQGLNIETKVKVGNVYKEIAEEVASRGVDLIIMGSKGASGLQELLVGSNAEKVVRHAPCPVITVKNNPKNFKIRDIIFASDFKESLEFDPLKKVQAMFFAKLHLLYINTPSNFETSSAVSLRMNAFAEEHRLDNYTINIYAAASEKEGILEFSEKINSDIVALATHNRKGILRWMMGSIAEDVVNHSRKILFTFPLKEKTITG